MSDSPPQFHTSSLGQVIATLFTCRSIIKYDLTLNESQKKEVLTDIDHASHLLQEHINSVPPSSQSSFSSHTSPPGEQPPSIGTDQLLYALYRIHYACLGGGQGKKINDFVDRFNRATYILDEVQTSLEERKSSYFYTQPAETPLPYVRDFIVDLYYLFVELARALSAVLQGKEFHADTEELSSMQQPQPLEKQPPLEEQNSLALLGVYEIYHHLTERKSVLSQRIADTTTFLEFLAEGFEAEGSKREKIVTQLEEAIGLLKELLLLISNYESIIVTWLHPT